MSKKWAGLILLSFLLLLPLANAEPTEESFSVYTDKPGYQVGDAVNIYVKANAIDPNQTITVTDVIVYDPSNLSVAEWHNLSIIFMDTTTPSHVGSFTVASPGNYTIQAKATGCPCILFAIFWFICWLYHHVIPEYPLGPLMGVLACITALVVWKKYAHSRALNRY